MSWLVGTVGYQHHYGEVHLETWESPLKEDSVLEMLGRMQITAEKETLSCSCLKPRCFLRGSCVAMDMDMLR